jgi:hypothetical protein
MSSVAAMFAVVFIIIPGTVASGDEVIVEELFDGPSASWLNGKSVSTFIITTGGDVDGLWDAKNNLGAWHQDGAVGDSVRVNSGAHIELGSYIDDARGTALGVFELSLEISELTDPDSGSSGFVSFGFAKAGPADNRPFFNVAEVAGRVTLTRRIEAEANTVIVYEGIGTGGTSASTTAALTDPQLFTIRLDLTAWDGATDFGTAAFYIGDSASGTQIGSTMDLDANTSSFPCIALTLEYAQGSIDNLKLIKVTQPAGPVVFLFR